LLSPAVINLSLYQSSLSAWARNGQDQVTPRARAADDPDLVTGTDARGDLDRSAACIDQQHWCHRDELRLTRRELQDCGTRLPPARPVIGCPRLPRRSAIAVGRPSGGPEPAVITGALDRVAQHLVGPRHHDEPPSTTRLRPRVRVMPARELPVCAADLVLARVPRDAQDPVMVLVSIVHQARPCPALDRTGLPAEPRRQRRISRTTAAVAPKSNGPRQGAGDVMGPSRPDATPATPRTSRRPISRRMYSRSGLLLPNGSELVIGGQSPPGVAAQRVDAGEVAAARSLPSPRSSICRTRSRVSPIRSPTSRSDCSGPSSP